MSATYPQLGSLLAGRYRLLRVLGEGGMGVVFEALHTLTERRVALKWMHGRLAAEPQVRARLMREALAVCRVSHPNVVEVYDVVEEAESVFLVMELLQGETMEMLLERGGTPLHELIGLVLQAMHGVAAAHSEGVVHRDIHPANIFLSTRAGSREVVPKVIDFGISKVSDDWSPALTREGTTLGTPQYMSLEQLCSASDVDGRADVYAFGVLLYRAATGRPPFDGKSFTEVAIKVGNGTPTPPKSLCVDLPTSLGQLILWAIARDRDKRIDSMATFIRELEPFANVHAFRAMMTVPDRAVPAVIARAGAPFVSKTPDEVPLPSRVRGLSLRARAALLVSAASLVVALVWTCVLDGSTGATSRADTTGRTTSTGKFARKTLVQELAPAAPERRMTPLTRALAPALQDLDASAPEGRLPARMAVSTPVGSTSPKRFSAGPASSSRPASASAPASATLGRPAAGAEPASTARADKRSSFPRAGVLRPGDL